MNKEHGLQKQLISQLSATIENKSVFVSERGLTSTQWPVYSGGTKRVQYSTVPGSAITAETVTVDGVTLSQKDTAGVVTTATRRLAIQKDSSWFSAPARLAKQGVRSQVCSRLGGWLLKPHPAYGWDLTKNICALYGPSGYTRTAYTYSPYGQVSSTGDVEQPIQWSSEYNDDELGLIYYNYRHYNPVDGRWTGRDNVVEDDNLYCYCENNVCSLSDIKGAYPVIVMIDSIGGPSVYIDSDLMRINFAYQKTIDELGKLQNREFEKLKENNSVLWKKYFYTAR